MHLIDGASGCYLWSESVDGSQKTRSPSKLIAGPSRRSWKRAVADGPKRGPSAGRESCRADLCLQGRYHLNQRTEEGLRKALDFFEHALGEDANYSLAHSGLADACGLLAHYGFGRRPMSGQGRRRARRPRSCSTTSAEGHLARAGQGDAGLGLGGVRARIQPRIALDPGTPRPTTGTASCLAPLGRLDEAGRSDRRAITRSDLLDRGATSR